MSNVEQLHDAGIVDKEKLSEEEQNALNALSPEEIESLKSIHRKLKAAGIENPTLHGSANCF